MNVHNYAQWNENKFEKIYAGHMQVPPHSLSWHPHGHQEL